jgi:hypothetical protein
MVHHGSDGQRRTALESRGHDLDAVIGVYTLSTRGAL